MRSAILISLFVFAFLFVFRPFGLSTVQGSLFLVTLIYGLITFTCLLITQVALPNLMSGYYDESNWTVGKEIVQTMGNILVIAVANFLFSAYLSFFPWSFKTLWLFIGFTLAVGIFPVVIQVLVRQNIYHRKNSTAASADNKVIHTKEEHLTTGESLKVVLDDQTIGYEGPASHLLALEASGNYVTLHLRSGKKELLRTPLSSIEDSLNFNFFRTHRSWVVNLTAIEKVEGNARGYTLHLETSLKVPVSRSRLKAFDEELRAV